MVSCPDNVVGLQVQRGRSPLVILCLLGWAFDTVFLLVERRLLAWQHGTVGGEQHV